jgi:hypothetical protein
LFALVLDDLPRADLATFPQLRRSIDFHLALADHVLGLATALGKICYFHEITEGDEITALEFKFFHALIVSESIPVSPVDVSLIELFSLNTTDFKVFQIAWLPEIHRRWMQIAVFGLLMVAVIRIFIDDGTISF